MGIMNLETFFGLFGLLVGAAATIVFVTLFATTGVMVTWPWLAVAAIIVASMVLLRLRRRA